MHLIIYQTGVINDDILLKDHIEPFTFQHTNLLTTWVITYRLYDHIQDFAEMKPIYL